MRQFLRSGTVFVCQMKLKLRDLKMTTICFGGLKDCSFMFREGMPSRQKQSRAGVLKNALDSGVVTDNKQMNTSLRMDRTMSVP